MDVQATAETVLWECKVGIGCRLCTCDVDDSKGLLDVAPHGLGAGGHDVVHAPLILLHVEFEHPVLRCDLIQPLDIDSSQMLNINRPSLRAIEEALPCCPGDQASDGTLGSVGCQTKRRLRGLKKPTVFTSVAQAVSCSLQAKE